MNKTKDFHTKLKTKKGKILDLGILKDVSNVYLDENLNVIIVDKENKIINLGNLEVLNVS